MNMGLMKGMSGPHKPASCVLLGRALLYKAGRLSARAHNTFRGPQKYSNFFLLF